jgi:hypothetical protein
MRGGPVARRGQPRVGPVARRRPAQIRREKAGTSKFWQHDGILRALLKFC